MDLVGGCLFFLSNGKIIVLFGFEECGQGILVVIEYIVFEELGCVVEDIFIVIGDIVKVLKLGLFIVFCGISMVWYVIQCLKKLFFCQLKKWVVEWSGCVVENFIFGVGGLCMFDINEFVVMFKVLVEKGFLVEEIVFDFLVMFDFVVGGYFFYLFGVVVVEVEVDLLIGDVKVIDCEYVIVVGLVVSLQGYWG